VKKELGKDLIEHSEEGRSGAVDDRTIATAESHRLQCPAMEPPRPRHPSNQRDVEILAPLYRNLRLERVKRTPTHPSRLISCFSRLIALLCSPLA
jgi:hypothetical protein